MSDIPNNGALRQAVIRLIFNDEDLKGARWDMPGWSEINDALDKADIKRSMMPHKIKIEDDVAALDAPAKRDLILSMVFTREQMSGARWETPGWAELNEGLEKAGLHGHFGQVSIEVSDDEPDAFDSMRFDCQ